MRDCTRNLKFLYCIVFEENPTFTSSWYRFALDEPLDISVTPGIQNLLLVNNLPGDTATLKMFVAAYHDILAPLSSLIPAIRSPSRSAATYLRESDEIVGSFIGDHVPLAALDAYYSLLDRNPIHLIPDPFLSRVLSDLETARLRAEAQYIDLLERRKQFAETVADAQFSDSVILPPLVSMLLEQITPTRPPAAAIVRLRDNTRRWRRKINYYHDKLERARSLDQRAAIKKRLADEFLPLYKKFRLDEPDERRVSRLIRSAGRLGNLYDAGLMAIEKSALFLDYLGTSRLLSPFNKVFRRAGRICLDRDMVLAKLGWFGA